MTLYEYYNTGDDDYYSIYDTTWRAQTFTVGTVGPNSDHDITSVKLKLFRLGSPGTLTVSIRATDADGHPTGDDLTSGTINGNTLTTDTAGAWYEISLTAYTLSAGTKYAIVARAPDGDTSNRVRWRADTTDPTYTGGNLETSTNAGISWTADTTVDLMFEEHSTTAPPAGGGMKPIKHWGV